MESSASGKDEDLIRPWMKVWKMAEADKGASGDSLHTALVKIESLIDEFKTKWDRDWALNNKAYGPIAQEASVVSSPSVFQLMAIIPSYKPGETTQMNGRRRLPRARTGSTCSRASCCTRLAKRSAGSRRTATRLEL